MSDDYLVGSEALQQRIVFPDAINDQGNLFGGNAMKWMDEIAYITATRFTRQKVVTVSVEKVKFRQVIPVGSLIEVRGRVISAGHVKLLISVEIWLNNPQKNTFQQAIEGRFIFAAIDDMGRPVRMNPANS